MPTQPRVAWSLIATACLVLLSLSLLLVMPSDFVGPLFVVLFLLLLLPGVWGLLKVGLLLTALSGRRRALDPNHSPEELKQLARHHPEVLQNKALPLLTLEDPNLFAALEEIAAATKQAQQQRDQELLRSMSDVMKHFILLPLILLLLLLWVWLSQPPEVEPSELEVIARRGASRYHVAQLFTRAP